MEQANPKINPLSLVNILTLRYDPLIKNNLPKTISSYHFRDYKKVYNFLIKKIDKKDLIMIKGSNSSMVNVIARKLLRKK